MMTTKRKTVVQLLRERELGVRPNANYSRINCSIVRKLIEDPRSTYKEQIRLSSCTAIPYEGGKIFLKDAKAKRIFCLSLYGCKYAAKKIYSLPARQKVEDCFIWRCPLYIPGKQKKDYRESYFTLTYDNYLRQYDIETGEQLQEIYLSSSFRYTDVYPDDEAGRIILKSTRSSRMGDTSNILLAMCVISYTPWRFDGCFKISKSVFGSTVVDAVPDQGMLMILHNNNTIKVYSLNQILETKVFEADVGEYLERRGQYLQVGKDPLGLPINVPLEEAPPVLYEVKSQRHQFHFGGHPWHYISACRPYVSTAVYEVYSAETRKVLENGTLVSDVRDIEPDHVTFHPDGSSRIIQNSSHYFQMYSVKNNCLTRIMRFDAADALRDAKTKPNNVVLGRTKSSGRNRKEQENIVIAPEVSPPAPAEVEEDHRGCLRLPSVMICNPEDAYMEEIVEEVSVVPQRTRTPETGQPNVVYVEEVEWRIVSSEDVSADQQRPNTSTVNEDSTESWHSGPVVTDVVSLADEGTVLPVIADVSSLAKEVSDWSRIEVLGEGESSRSSTRSDQEILITLVQTATKGAEASAPDNQRQVTEQNLPQASENKKLPKEESLNSSPQANGLANRKLVPSPPANSQLIDENCASSSQGSRHRNQENNASSSPTNETSQAESDEGAPSDIYVFPNLEVNKVLELIKKEDDSTATKLRSVLIVDEMKSRGALIGSKQLKSEIENAMHSSVHSKYALKTTNGDSLETATDMDTSEDAVVASTSSLGMKQSCSDSPKTSERTSVEKTCDMPLGSTNSPERTWKNAESRTNSISVFIQPCNNSLITIRVDNVVPQTFSLLGKTIKVANVACQLQGAASDSMITVKERKKPSSSSDSEAGPSTKRGEEQRREQSPEPTSSCDSERRASTSSDCVVLPVAGQEGSDVASEVVIRAQPCSSPSGESSIGLVPTEGDRSGTEDARGGGTASTSTQTLPISVSDYITRSGRVVRRSLDEDTLRTSLFGYDICYAYEDELDLLALLVTHGVEGSEGTFIEKIFLFDNQTGKHIKILHIGRTIPYCVHVSSFSLSFDMDTIVVTVKLGSGRTTVFVYRLEMEHYLPQAPKRRKRKTTSDGKPRKKRPRKSKEQKEEELRKKLQRQEAREKKKAEREAARIKYNTRGYRASYVETPDFGLETPDSDN